MNKANAVMTLSTLALAIGVSLASQSAMATDGLTGEMSEPFDITNIWFTFGHWLSGNGDVVTHERSASGGVTNIYRMDLDTGISTNIGTLKANNSGNAYLSGISKNGLVIIGRSENEQGVLRAFKHVAGDSKLRDLGSLRTDKLGESKATDVSADGLVIAGVAINDSGEWRAFYHIDQRGMTDLGTLRSDGTGKAVIGHDGAGWGRAVSNDGSVIVGAASTDQGTMRAYRYQQDSMLMTDLGSLRSDKLGESEAVAVSADGLVTTGWARNDEGVQRAFRHQAGDNNLVDLGTHRSDNSGLSIATAMSADGRVIVGAAATDEGSRRAFKYSSVDGQFVDLGTLEADNSGSSTAHFVSDDGRVVVGDAYGRSNMLQAFRYVEGSGRMVSLGNLAGETDLITGDTYATGMSADGSIITGISYTVDDGYPQRMFVWRAFKAVEPPVEPGTDPTPVPDPGSEGSGGVMQDLGYLFDSMPLLAAQTEQAFRAQQRSLGRQLDNACVSSAEGLQCLRLTGELSKVTDAPSELDYQVAPALALAYGYGVTDQLTAGVTASMFGSSLDNQLLTERGGAELDSGVGVGSYLHFSQGADETGVQAGVSLGYSEQRGEFVRGDGLANVQHGKGKADVKSVAVRGSLGYGVEVADWKVTPHAEVTHFINSRDGYREGGERLVFDVEHDKVKDKSTMGKVGVKGETTLAKGVTLKLDTGVEVDLDVNPVTLKGKSDIFSLGEGMQAFSVSAELERNDMRPYAAVGVGYELEQAGTVGLNVKASQVEYGNQGVDGSVQLSYELKF